MVQEYLNEISPTIYGPNKSKTSGKPSEYLIYRPLLQIITNRPPCSVLNVETVIVKTDGSFAALSRSQHRCETRAFVTS